MNDIYNRMIVEEVPSGGYKAWYLTEYEWGNTEEEAKLALLEKLQKKS